MVKSLDDLIRHLVDEVALRGEEGILPSDFAQNIVNYYGEQSQPSNDTTTCNDDGKPNRESFTIDRAFQEQVWRWLTRHPEIRVGKNREGNELSLSEVEALNSTNPTVEHSKQSVNNNPVLGDNAATSSSRNTQSRLGSPTNGLSIPVKKGSNATSAKAKGREEPKRSNSLRLYGSEARMWQVIAGHAPDQSKVPAMDFACLSIIAARGPRGILQPELVAVSGQDKRSLPKRTERLQTNGYIEKRPVLVCGSRTSLCILKRFVTAPFIIEGASTSTEDSFSPHLQKDSVLDLSTLTHGIFDNLRDLEIITTMDLKKRLGVWGLRWPMKVLARTLRRLEALGCVKQIRAQANSNIATSLYFRCIKLIREPDEKELHLFLSPHRGLSNTTTLREDEDLEADGEEDEDDDLDRMSSLRNDETAAPVKDLREVGRPIAQWGGDQCLNNFLFDLIDNTSTQGMSSMDIKRFALGGLVRRPLEYQLGRLVNQWQVSQPPHLRHLAIIRDTATNKTVSHYIHYSYESFKALVDSGKASWEAVETITENRKKGKNSFLTVNAEPDLDEYGFPKLQATLFQGHHNSATPSECALAVKAKALHLTSLDLIPKKLDDGTYVVLHETQPRVRRGPHTLKESKESTAQKLSFKPRGRPRKVPRTGLPSNMDTMTPEEIHKLTRLQKAAVKYDVLKIEKEIDRRVDAGEDRTRALDRVLHEVDVEHTQIDLPPSLAAKAVYIRANMLGDRENKPILPPEVLAEMVAETKMNSLEITKKGRRPRGIKNSLIAEYLPSTVAHSQLVTPQPPSTPTIHLESPPKKTPYSSRTDRIFINFTYMPSVFAHTQPILHSPSSAQSTTTPQLKQKPIGSAEKDKHKGLPDLSAINDPTRSQDTPYDLSGCDLPTWKKRNRKQPPKRMGDVSLDNVSTGHSGFKRKWSGIESHEFNKRVNRQYLPSIAAHTQDLHHGQESLFWNNVGMQNESRGPLGGHYLESLTQAASPESSKNRLLGSRTESEMRNYRKQVNEIKRPKDGIFIGSRSVVYRKGGHGPRKSQFAIFKSQRLGEFSWFQKDTSSCGRTLQSSSEDCEARPRASFSFTPTPNQLDNGHSGGGESVPSPAHASLAGPTDPTYAPEHEPHSMARPKRKMLLVKLHVRSSSGPTSPSTDEKIRPTSLQSVQESVPIDSTKQTNSTLLKSLGKKRPFDHVHEGAPDDPPCMNEGLASNEIKPLDVIPEQSSFSQRPRPLPFGGSVDGCTLESRKEFQENKIGPPEATPTASGSYKDNRLLINQIPSECGLTGSPFRADDHPADSSHDDSIQETVETKRRSRTKVTPKLSLTGGSVGLLRRKIVMDIVQKCGGVFPSDRELVYPFAYAWHKEGRPGTPEKSTVTAACKSLYASGKLRQLYFSFKDKTGLMVTKPMMAIREVSPDDPKVKKVQQKIIELYPRPYVPDEAEISEDVRNRFTNPQVYGTNRTFPHLEIDHEARVQLQHKPQFVQRIEAVRNPRAPLPRRRKISERGEGSGGPSPAAKNLNNDQLETSPAHDHLLHGSALLDSSHGFVRRPDLDPALGPPVRKVQRLASIRKHRSGLDTSHNSGHHVPPRQDERATEAETRARHLNLSSETVQPHVILSEVDSYDNAGLTLGAKAESTGAWRQKALFPSVFSTEAASPKIGLPKMRGQIPGVAPSNEARTVPSRKAPYKKRTKPYLPSIAAHTQPYLRPIRKYRYKQYLPSIAAHTQPISKPVAIKRKNNKQLQSLESLNDVVSSPSARVSRVKVMYAMKTSETLSIDPWYAHQQISTIMDPDHLFHPTTGTFSTIFRVPKDRGRRTQTIAQQDTCKADQVYSDWSLSNQPYIDWFHPRRAQNAAVFEAEVDAMLLWELETEGIWELAFTNQSFINFTFYHPHRLSTNDFIDINKAVEVSFSQVNGRILYKPFTPSIAPIAKIDQKIPSKATKRAAPVVPAAGAVTQSPAKRKRRKEPKDKFMSRRLTSLPEGRGYGLSKTSKAAPGKFDADGRPTKLRRIRGPQTLQGLGEQGEKRLIFATLVIRTLTGGVERHIDWVLVTRLFPEFDQIWIQNRWNSVLNKYRFEYERLYIEFQDMYARAYEDGSVPPIDYEDLENYDWAWLVDWTMENIEAPSKNLPELPAERIKFDDRFIMKKTHEHNMHAFYETDAPQALLLRTNNLIKQSYVYSAVEKGSSTSAQEPEQFVVAKSWIRANIMTPEANYNPEVARAKLLTFNEATIELALKDLMATRILSQQNKGRLVPGRNYNISQHVLDRLKKNLDAERYLCAAAYKRRLDKDLEEKGAVEFSPSANDGIVLAVLNLQAHGRIEVRPKNPPMNKFGLTDGGYETRKMDKSRLNFTCEIRLRDAYIAGNPLLPLPPPPSQHLGIPLAKIPLWYDIHDTLIPAVWDLVLAATMAVVALRPGIGAEEMAKSMRPSLETWELEMVLEWMVLATAAKRVGKGFTVEEWWWLCMETGERKEDARIEPQGHMNMNIGGD